MGLLIFDKLDRRILLIASIALILEFIALFFDIHFIWKQPETLVIRPKMARISNVIQSVMIRHPLELHWNEAMTGEELSEGDEIVTLADSKAELRFADGKILTLGQNSLLELRKAVTFDQAIITLVSGTLHVSRGKTKDVSIIEGTIELENPQDIPTLPKPPIITIKNHIAPLAKPQLLRPNIKIEKDNSRPSIEPPLLKKPTIFYPRESNAIIKFINIVTNALISPAIAAENEKPWNPHATAVQAPPVRKYKIELQWQDVKEAQAYIVQISADPDFRSIVAEKYNTKTQFEWSTDNPGLYYWRVAAVDKQGDRGPFSEFMTFQLLAERNQPHNETTFDTYLHFDEYNPTPHRLRLLGGPALTSYHFESDGDPSSPTRVDYSSTSYKQSQLEYEYRINNYYSAQGFVRYEQTSLTAKDFKDRPRQNPLMREEAMVSIGIERRIFAPRHYYIFQAGIRMNLTDIPDKDSDFQLSLRTFGFFGPYFQFGIAKELWKNGFGQILVGAVAQAEGAASRIGEQGSIALRQSLNSELGIGIRLDQDLRFYHFNDATVSGSGRAIIFRPMVELEFNF